MQRSICQLASDRRDVRVLEALDKLVDSGGEGEEQVAEGASSKVGSNGCSVEFQEIVHPVQRGVCRLPVDCRDVRVFEALGKLVDGGGRHGEGLTN